MLTAVTAKISGLGKPEWRPMLNYVAELHSKSIRDPRSPFQRPWEEIGPGYCYGPAFGHWDIVHAVLDTMPYAPNHARTQLLNNVEAQQEDGLVPGVIYFKGDSQASWNKTSGHPPLWEIAVQDYTELTGSQELIQLCYQPLLKLIGWYERFRKAEGIGFYYTDILNHKWESGVDEGIRFKNIATGPYACVDATSHVYLLYRYASQWSILVDGEDTGGFAAKADQLRDFIQNELFDEATGFFHDIWAVGKPEVRRFAYEGMWPMVVGAATPEQARRVIDENLLNPERFLTPHPIATVAANDSDFELRMWRGPAWNSMTYWAARGCKQNGRNDAARVLLEKALDDSAAQFRKTGTIWEFYHPFGGDQMQVQRKPHTPYNTPCRDYLGHNPLLAMARMWEEA